MHLVEDGKLRLADPIAMHIPEFATNGKDKLTVHDLLTHQSGLIADNPIADYADGPAEALGRVPSRSGSMSTSSSERSRACAESVGGRSTPRISRSGSTS